MTVNHFSPPEPAPAAMVTSGYLRLYRAAAALGRTFLPEGGGVLASCLRS